MSIKVLPHALPVMTVPGSARPGAWPERAAFPSGFWIGLATLIAAFANFNFIWNQFYRRTPFLFDTAWYAHLIHRSAPVLQNPPPVRFDTIGADFYATHFSPLLWVFSWPTYFLPVSSVTWLAVAEGTKYALIALIVGLALRNLPRRDRAPLCTAEKCAALAVLLLAPFNGIALANIDYPHFEGWFIVGALGFLLALFREQLWTAAAVFVATLLLREDMGFHLCGLLVLAGLARFATRRVWDRELSQWGIFAAVGFVWSIAALALMRWQFPGDDAFTRIYAGSPPWAHLNGTELWNRFTAHLQTRLHFWLPLAVFTAWAIARRSGWVLLGYAAFMPWVAVNFIAHSQAAATLALYYSFPLGVALLWPLVAHFAFAPRDERFGCGWLAAALALSVAGFIPTYLAPPRFPWEDFLFPTLQTRAALTDTTQKLASAVARGEAVAIDDAVAALAPGAFTAKNLLWQGQQGVGLASFYSSGRSQQLARETIFQLGLPYNYRVRGTGMVVVAAKPLDWPHLEFKSARPGSMSLLLHGENPDLSWSAVRPDPPVPRNVSESPKLYFTAGPATATFVVSIEKEPSASSGTVVLEVVSGHNADRMLASAVIAIDDLPSGTNEIERALDFSIPFDQGAGVQLRVRASAGSRGKIRDLVLVTSPPIPANPAPANATPAAP